MALKKIRRRVKTILTKPFKKGRKPLKPPQDQFSPSPTPEPIMPPSPPPRSSSNDPFLFPHAQTTVVPDPSRFFSPDLLKSPLPTNSFFQNFVLKNGDQPEYIHPYLIKSSSSSLSLCFPPRFVTSAYIYQIFNADFTISAAQNPSNEVSNDHKISSFSDLSVTLDLPHNLRFFLVRGSPFITCSVTNSTPIYITTIHAILSISSNTSLTKHTIRMNNNQTWLLYTSSPFKFTSAVSSITCDAFSGVIRFAILPDSGPHYESILDQCSCCYPVSGNATFTNPFSLEYRWEKKGWGDLLLLANPLQIQLLCKQYGNLRVLNDFKYKSMDGDLVGVIGDSWLLKTNPVSITWHSIGGIKEESFNEIVSALSKDVEGLNSTPITTNSSYFYGKLIARAARLALIAEEVSHLEMIPTVQKYLKESLEPWLDGTFAPNAFLFDPKWGGLVTKQGSLDSGADFGFGVYNDHHYHLGYFLYGIAVLAKIDPAWGRKYKRQAYSLMADFMNLGRQANSVYPRLRNFDLWKLHSWAGGLTEFADGRNQESTSEAINAYYAASLMGLCYGDTHLVALGSTLTAFEMQAAQTWWHVREGDKTYEEEFTKENRMMGVLWSSKRDTGLWFAPPAWKECRLGIQLLPLLPISEVLFADTKFAKELVTWTLPALERDGVGEGWKGFVYAMEGIYDKEGALEKIKKLKGHDDGNSLSNLLWWIHSRGDGKDDGGHHVGRYCWSRHYSH
ncbi:endo-1,3(4)-beta-glucanase [Ranunculus cassubicifolius]